MTLTEKWERFKAEQKEPGYVPEPLHKIPDIPAVQKIDSSNEIKDLVFARITEHTLVVEKMTVQNGSRGDRLLCAPSPHASAPSRGETHTQTNGARQ